MGHDLPADGLVRLRLGVSTAAMVRDMLGAPMVGGTVDPGGGVDTFWYYAYRRAPATRADCASDKTGMVVFRGGVLASYALAVRIVPPTPGRIGGLKAGVASRADVISALGAPTEEAAYGFDKAGAPERIGYSWVDLHDPGDGRRHLVIWLDGGGRMVGVARMDHESPGLGFRMCRFARPAQATP